nr:hypothetical protein [Prevotella sp.]
MNMRLLAILFLGAMAIPSFAQYREVRTLQQPKETNYRDYTSQEQGFWYAVEAEGGSSIMEHKTNMQYVNLTFTGGYRINEYLRVGAGFGGRMYVNNASVRNSNSKFGIPIFANIRGNIISAKDRDGVPFWSVNVGGITNDGAFFSPTIGYSFGGLRNNFQVGVSYTLSNLKDNTGVRQNYSYFGLKLGYEF